MFLHRLGKLGEMFLLGVDCVGLFVFSWALGIGGWALGVGHWAKVPGISALRVGCWKLGVGSWARKRGTYGPSLEPL